MTVHKDNFKKKIQRIADINEIGIILPLVILLIIISFVNTSFFSVNNISSLLRTTSYTFLIAAPLTILLITGGFDLSIGAMTTLGGVVCAWGMVKWGLSPIMAIIVALLVGLAIGLLKSVIVVYSKLPAFIATLGLQYVVNGFLMITTQSRPVTGFESEAFEFLGQGKVFGLIHITTIIAIVLAVALSILLARTKFGRSVYAVGGNAMTARLAGINVTKVKVIAEVLVSVMSIFCGVCFASRFASAQPTAGKGTELTITAAVIIGGTSMYGGSGTMWGSFLGCVLMAVIDSGLVYMHVPSFWIDFIFGIAAYDRGSVLCTASPDFDPTVFSIQPELLIKD